MEVALIKPQGFCSGVTRAVEIAKKAKQDNPNKNIFVLGMLAHNQSLIDELTKEGIITLLGDPVEELNKLSSGDVIIFTAHGHDEKLDILAEQKGLISYDATCFKVKDNINKIKREISNEHQVIYIGQKGHKEAEAALSISENVSLYDTKLLINYYLITDESPFVFNQTTLNFYELNKYHEDIKTHFPKARIENEICNATRLRQENIINLPSSVDLILVVGDTRSSNSNRLLEIAKAYHPNVPSRLINSVKDLDSNLLENKNHIAIASGASTPISSIDMIVEYLNNFR